VTVVVPPYSVDGATDCELDSVAMAEEVMVVGGRRLGRVVVLTDSLGRRTSGCLLLSDPRRRVAVSVAVVWEVMVVGGSTSVTVVVPAHWH
jgi:hypothetical protein